MMLNEIRAASSVHLCIDMQRVFADDTPWHTPWFGRVLPRVVELSRAWGERTVFTRFMPPRQPQQRPGQWQRYFERWRSLTLEQADPGLFELVPELAALVPPARVIDKRAYSPFHDTALRASLEQGRVETVIVSGTETDVCVLAAALGAVDCGFRVVIAEDAICSSSDATHEAILTFFRHRLREQVEVADTASLVTLAGP
ncbi:cysteine hydrolase family protein [Solimonas soli]|uniref:cysteine hydrolase family protein n=1 Tax=Solimonas soli TaxID=413479 RepID=UPI0005B87FA1|nr:isochorismatase family cysteine hydrolase [Solimonas soli]